MRTRVRDSWLRLRFFWQVPPRPSMIGSAATTALTARPAPDFGRWWLLDAAAPQRLDELTPGDWERWAAVVVGFPVLNPREQW